MMQVCAKLESPQEIALRESMYALTGKKTRQLLFIYFATKYRLVIKKVVSTLSISFQKAHRLEEEGHHLWAPEGMSEASRLPRAVAY